MQPELQVGPYILQCYHANVKDSWHFCNCASVWDESISFHFLFSFINNTFRVFFLLFSQIIYVLLMESLYIFDKIEVKIYYLHIGKRNISRKETKNVKY